MKKRKKDTKIQKIITSYGMMLLGAFIFAVACNYFIVPSGLNNSGVIGFAQIVRESLDRFTFIHLPISTIGILNFTFNIPLLLLAWIKISKKFCINTLLCVGAQTIFLTLVPIMKEPILDIVLANAVIGGIIAGVGSGFMLRGGSCSGGIDIFMTVVSKQEVNKLKQIVHECDPKAFVIFNEGMNVDGNFEKRLA